MRVVIDKKLDAKHYEHPDESLPKIFISELKVEEFDQELQDTVNQLIDQITDDAPAQFDFCSMGRPWDVSYTTYVRIDMLKLCVILFESKCYYDRKDGKLRLLINQSV